MKGEEAMFNKTSKPQNRIDSLIGATTRIEGNVIFSGGLRVDGMVRGNVAALPDQPGTLVVSAEARIDGEVQAAHIVVNGTIHGPGYSGSGGIGAAYTLPNGKSFADDFHVFAVDWSPSKITWSVDGQVYETRTPSDVNGNGDVFGGWVMAQVDIAGGVAAARRARGRVATVAVTDFLFKQPISVGDVVSFYTRIERVGRTSVTVHVAVFAERNPADPVVCKVTEATLTYVAIDRDGQPREIPVTKPA